MTITQARDAAKVVVGRIVNGEIDAYEGAMRIWKDILDELADPIPDDLWPFKANASAIEDCLWDAEESGSNHDAIINQCRGEIVRAAAVLHQRDHE